MYVCTSQWELASCCPINAHNVCICVHLTSSWAIYCCCIMHIMCVCVCISVVVTIHPHTHIHYVPQQLVIGAGTIHPHTLYIFLDRWPFVHGLLYLLPSGLCMCDICMYTPMNIVLLYSIGQKHCNIKQAYSVCLPGVDYGHGCGRLGVLICYSYFPVFYHVILRCMGSSQLITEGCDMLRVKEGLGIGVFIVIT